MSTALPPPPPAEPAPTVLGLPFTGRWLTQNSPANRVPSHGTDLFGTTYAIDFVAVDGHGRSGPPGWRALFATEAPEDFRGFGTPVLAPSSGTVVSVHDGEPDHEARRSQPALLAYALTQAGRVRQGPNAIAGNHVVIALAPDGPYVLLAHLRRGSIAAVPGALVAEGARIGGCGNSGNSTEPHVHLQVTDSTDWSACRGLPLAFRHPDGGPGPWLPRNGTVFNAW
ncbi:M23 family metallopeptidase [Arthrobacter sp. zg-Y20]|uniref:M23 family metallopeptidase n=1 Tax=unclassified Arthrobacter TaxID=235627 RepID=UPI001D1505AB|nr:MULTISPECIES: M23 family metallopeptidase [unclassified Arthrobacter]MCC3275293.1 M23 family metallopeptidase [Arthrobacter sp. zg-Y20]MDK1315451.1 M23 family metallopeptidase [Arthrobacter sp. zg.Y20]MDK1326554.1 M23 family metallopeptidase [Arthrobacter sp. zg-Y1143]WIB05868.1 M23 family metallopeptidase [Arthrobacter sp. zg-Y20]